MCVGNCSGCEYELQDAYWWQTQGYHVATTDDYPSTYPIRKGHYANMIVDDEGRLIQW